MVPNSFINRVTLFAVVPVLAAGVAMVRLINLQVVGPDKYVAAAEAQQHREQKITAHRGRIVDRNGSELAASVMLDSLYARPKYLFSPSVEETTVTNVLRTLSGLLGAHVHDEFFARESTKTMVLARRLDPPTSARLKSFLQAMTTSKTLSGSGWWLDHETQRFYSRGNLAPHVVGYTAPSQTGDNQGMDGVEKSYDTVLCGTNTTYTTPVNSWKLPLAPAPESVEANTMGQTVVLTIDETIQEAAERALANQVQMYRALSGICVVQAVRTGEILAMANYPTYDLNQRGAAGPMQRRNRCIADTIEPGSVFKTFTFLSLFEEGKLSATDMVNCEGGLWHMGSRVIRDAHGMGTVTARDVYKESSNVGTLKLATRLTKEQFSSRLKLLGFGSETGIDLPGESGGLLRKLDKWTGLSMSSIPMGYEVTASGVQLCAAVSAIANDGVYLRPHVVKEVRDHRGSVVREIKPEALRQVASARSSKQVLELMRACVEEGTGKEARLDGWTAGGKTGTTKKIDPSIRAYSARKYISSFVGVAPLENPDICVYIYIDEADPNLAYYGGKVAAPVFKPVAETALRVRRVPQPFGKASDAPAPNVRSLDVAMNRLKDELAGRVPLTVLQRTTLPEQRPNASVMPDLSGLTMREAKEALAALGMSYQFAGSGVVAEQNPRPHETVTPGATVRLRFAPETRRLDEIAKRTGAASKAEVADAIAEPSDAPTSDEKPQVLLERGRSALRLDVKPAAERVLLNEAKALERTSEAAPAKVDADAPDMDQYAQGAPTPGLGQRVWSEWFAEESGQHTSGHPHP